jgi:hypothetical protein
MYSGVKIALFSAREIRHASLDNRRESDVHRVDGRGVVGVVGAGGIMALLTIARPFILRSATKS